MDSQFSIVQITAEETRSLRHRVLRPHQTLADCVYPGDDAEDSFHYGARNNDGDIVCIASVFTETEPQFGLFKRGKQQRLRGMATLEFERNKGLGMMVLDTCIRHSKDDGVSTFWCNARTSAAEFYRKAGFNQVPTTFDIPGIGPHWVMYLSL